MASVVCKDVAQLHSSVYWALYTLFIRVNNKDFDQSVGYTVLSESSG